MRVWPVFFFAVVVAAVQGCVCRDDPDRPPSVEEDGQHFLLCGRIADDRSEETVEAGSTTLVRRGFEVTLQGEGDGRTKLGVIAGTEEWNQANRQNIDALLAWFREERVEAIVLAGGIGRDRQTCLNVLTRLASSEVPVFPLIGASADFAGYRRAVAQVRQEHSNVVDLTVARVVRWDGVDLVSLPGYHNPFYLQHRRGGCAYEEGDVRALARLVRSAERPVLLVAADPPRGRGRSAIDYARGGANIGSPAIAELIESGRVPFGVFGHVYEAGGRATADVAGGRLVPPGTWSRSLYLNPGAVEAVPYDLADGGRATGLAAVLEIGSEGARFQVRQLRGAPAGGDAEARAR